MRKAAVMLGTLVIAWVLVPWRQYEDRLSLPVSQLIEVFGADGREQILRKQDVKTVRCV